jgi:hypothetical protein
LFREAVAHGVPMTQGVYKVDKWYVKAKKVKKRLTLPKKMRLKGIIQTQNEFCQEAQMSNAPGLGFFFW